MTKKQIQGEIKLMRKLSYPLFCKREALETELKAVNLLISNNLEVTEALEKSLGITGKTKDKE